MSCIRLTKTNNNQSILFDKLFEIVKNEELANSLYSYFDTKDFENIFGDYKNNYSVSNTYTYDSELGDRTDENGEPILYLDTNLDKYYFLDKENEKVYYPYSDTGLNQFFETNDIKLFAKTIALSFYKNNVDFDFENLTFNVNKSLVSYTKEFIDSKIDELTHSPNFLHRSKGISLNNTKDNINEWVKEVQDFFTSIKTDYEIKDEQDIEDETSRNDLIRKESFTVSSKTNINNNIKLFLSLIQDNELNDFNEYNFVSFDKIYSQLNKILNNQVAITDNSEVLYDIQLEKIKELVSLEPYIQELYDKLNNTNITDTFKNQFSSTFNLFKKNYLISEIYTDENNVITYNVKNLTDTGSRKLNLLNNWYFTYTNIAKVKPQYLKQLVNESYTKLFKNINKIENIKEYESDLKDILNKLGVSFSDKGFNYFKNGLSFNTNTLEEDKQFLLKSYSLIERALDFNIKNTEENLFTDQTYFKDLAEAEAFVEDSGTDASVFTLGKTKWFFSNPSYLDLKVEEWKKNPKLLIDHYESTAYNRGSHWMKYLTASEIENYEDRLVESKKRLSNIKVGVFNSVQTKNDSANGFDNKNISYTDSLVDYLNKILAYRKGADTYHKTALAADKSTEYQIHYGNNSDFFAINTELQFEDNKFKVSDKVLDIFYNYFKSEYNRIKTVYDEIQSGEGNIPNYHLGRANGLKSQLMPSLSDNSKIKLYDVNGKPLYDNLDQIKNDIKSYISDNFNNLIIKNYNTLLKNQVFVYNEEGVRVNKLLDNSIYENYRNNVANKNHIYYHVAADFLINSIISQVEYSKMYTGDVAYYKDISDYKKRVPETYTDGKYLNNLTEDELFFNVAIINSVEIGYQDMVTLRETLDEKVYKYYEDNINDTDAQAWITPERWLFIMDKLGKKNKQIISLYKKMNSSKPKFTNKELKILAQPLKGVYFDISEGKPVYLKYSQAVLLPNLIKGTGLETLYKRMLVDKVDELVTRDGIKVGYPTPVTTHDSNGNVEKEVNLSSSIIKLNNSKWKLQQDLPTKGIKSTPIGSQIQKNIYQGLIHGNLEKEFYTDNDVFNGDELIQEINSIINELSNKGMEVVKNKLGLDDNFKIEKPDTLYKNIIKQLKSRSDSNPNIIKALEIGTSPYGIPGGLDVFQNIFSSIINDNTVKIETNGGGFIQMANYGINKETADKQNIIYTPWHDKNHLPMPEVYIDENGRKRLKPSGIFISGSFIAKEFPNYKNVSIDKLFGTKEDNYTDGIIDKSILENIIGYRIPNQGLASNDALQILGILPEEIGDTVIAYTGITKKTGSDFDIDKMYLMLPSFSVEREDYVDVDNYVYKNLKGSTIKDTINNILDLIEKLDPEDNSYDIDPTKFAQLIINPSKDLNDLKNYYLKELSTSFINYEGNDIELLDIKKSITSKRVSKIKYETYDNTLSPSEQTSKALKNRLIELYKSVLTSEHTINETFTPIDLKFMENDIKSLLPVEDINDFEDLNAIEDLELKNEFILAKAGLGQNVNSLVDSVRGAMADLSFNNLYIGMGLSNEKGETIFDNEMSESLNRDELNGYFVSYNKKAKELGKNPITKEELQDLTSIKLNTAMMVLANGFVDVAKDSYIAKGNWVTQTNNVGFMLLRSGTHLFKVNALLNQPYIKDFIKFRSNMESNSIKDSSSLFTKFLLTKLYDKVESTIGSDTVSINGLNYTYNNIFKSILTNQLVINNHKLKMLDSKKEDTGEAYNLLIKDLKVKIAKKFNVTKQTTDANPELKPQLEEVLNNILNYHDNIFKKVKKGKDALTLTTLRKEILENETIDNQLYYLNYFEYLTKHAKKLSKNVKASKVDVDGKGKDIISTIISNNLIKNLINNSLNDEELKGFSSKLKYNDKKTILKTYIDNSIGFSYKIMQANPTYFLISQKNVIKTFNTISKFVYDSFLENDTLGKKLEKAYYSYTMSGFQPLQLTKAEKNKLITKLPAQLEQFKKDYPNNKLLQELYINTNKNVNFIAMSNIKKSNVFKNDITDSWSQLLETDTEFAEDLIKYSYLISGFNNSISQFHEFIPYQWFNKNRFNSYLKSNIRNLKDTDTNFINQFFRNNLSDNTLSTEVYNNQLSRTDNSFIYVKGEHLDTETKPYMVRRNVMLDEFSGDKEMRYYKLEGQSGQDFIYTRVLPLSYKDNKGNKFVEYNNSNDYRNDNPLISIFDSNKINNYNFEQVKEFTKLFNPVEDVNTEEDNYMEQYDREESFNISNPNVGLDETLDFDNSQELWNSNKDLLEANGMNEESFNQMYNEFGEDSIVEYIKKCKS